MKLLVSDSLDPEGVATDVAEKESLWQGRDHVSRERG